MRPGLHLRNKHYDQDTIEEALDHLKRGLSIRRVTALLNQIHPRLDDTTVWRWKREYLTKYSEA